MIKTFVDALMSDRTFFLLLKLGVVMEILMFITGVIGRVFLGTKEPAVFELIGCLGRALLFWLIIMRG